MSTYNYSTILFILDRIIRLFSESTIFLKSNAWFWSHGWSACFDSFLLFKGNRAIVLNFKIEMSRLYKLTQRKKCIRQRAVGSISHSKIVTPGGKINIVHSILCYQLKKKKKKVCYHNLWPGPAALNKHRHTSN